MKKLPARLKWTVVGVGAGAALVAVAVYGLFFLSLPRTSGTVSLPGLTAEVVITRDEVGIPRIDAASQRDAGYALGYVHAQDRLWQMDFMRRLGNGRLAEVIGEPGLPSDRFTRTLGLAGLAREAYRQASPRLREIVDAYTAGVNAYLEYRDGPLPPAFQILRYSPEPWRPADSLVWGRVMNMRLSGNWREELMRTELAQWLNPAQIAELWPAYPEDAPITTQQASHGDFRTDGLDGSDQANVSALVGKLAEAVPDEFATRRSASNSWVIAGTRSETGMPILANDPHLQLGVPGTWYLARLHAPGLSLVGATAPGVPFHIVGHNGSIAWGLTTTHSDTQDLVIEKLDPDQPDHYLTETGAAPFRTHEEIIEVRGQPPVRMTVRSSRHGPIISDIIPNAATGAGFAIALADPNLRTDDESAEAFMKLNRAGSWTEFQDSLRQFHAPHQNFVYADVAGNIGFIAAARVPIRKKGLGLVPTPGWTGEYGWSGFIPFEDLPRAYNPKSGQILAANNRIVPPDYPHFLTRDWPAPFRAQRISDLLASESRMSPAHSVAMQRDTLSLSARRLAPLMTGMIPSDFGHRELLQRLQGWDGEMSRESVEALVFTAWVRELGRSLYRDELRDQFPRYWAPRYLFLLNTLQTNPAWCDDVTTPYAETCAEIVSMSFRRTIENLRENLGSDMSAWTWGRVHEVAFDHPILSHLPVLGWLSGEEISTDGNDDTINRGTTRFSDPARPFTHIHGPGMRAVFDLSNLDESLFIATPGQSGHVLSAHYMDLAAPWRDGGYVKIRPLAARDGDRLILQPAPDRRKN